MSQKLEGTLAALLERILILTNQDAELRTHLRDLAQMVLIATDERAAVAEQKRTEVDVAERVQATLQSLEAVISDQREEQAPTASTRLPELTLGRTVPPAESPKPVYAIPRGTATDFTLIESRCRLKAEGARWAATRRRMIADGADFDIETEPAQRNIIARAKELPNCFLWMNHPSGPSPSDLSLYEDLAGCFETLADAVALVKQIQDEPEIGQGEFEGALDLLAEAQSALRVAVEKIEGNPDSDQNEVFYWLRTTSNEHQILIKQFMRLDDPANPSQWSELAGRIETVDARLQEGRRRSRQRKKLLGKVRHKASLIAAAPDNSDDHWRVVAATVEELVNNGLPTSNRELRELLVPVIEYLPDFPDLPRGFQLVLREIDRFMATCPPPESPTITQPAQQVLDAAKLLKGKAMILIGGDRRPAAFKAIKESLGLSELFWIETQDHDSIEKFEPYVARPEVAVVLLAIRWSSHSYGEVRAFCERFGKPLVRLPGGYNPNQVAAQIMSQCSDRLK
jgi:hypothetical protein